jgi:glycosyltransferase involved in cell wall biosynthesis
MKILITTVQVPFIRGGAELMTDSLRAAIHELGHQVEVVMTPFIFHNKSAIIDSIEFWKKQNFSRIDFGDIDQVICLKFPTYHVQHDNKKIWLMHQHRSVYELFGGEYGDAADNNENINFRNAIHSSDNELLSKEKNIYTISKNVSSRLLKYNGVKSKPLYQPPYLAGMLKRGASLPYIFCPSRLETLKRQDLLIKAAGLINANCMIYIAGSGGQEKELKSLVAKLGLENKVVFLGSITDSQMVEYYSNCLGVFFGPFDEDYGMITLEAMLSSKPVITCLDSGGPLEFILHGETGFVVDPNPHSIAKAIDNLLLSNTKSIEMGNNARIHYNSMNISWNGVVEELLK